MDNVCLIYSKLKVHTNIIRFELDDLSWTMQSVLFVAEVVYDQSFNPYTLLRVLAGLTKAALIVWNPTVKKVRASIITRLKKNIAGPMVA